MITKEQVASLYNMQPDPIPLVPLNDLTDKTERTLIYGYTHDRETHHVYIKDGSIHTVCYFYEKPVRPILVEINAEYVPNMRIYPTRSDFAFCQLLAHRGVHLSFTGCDELELTRIKGNYFGEILPD